MTGFPPNSYFANKGICVCDPTRGEECRVCNGEAAQEREDYIALRESMREQK